MLRVLLLTLAFSFSFEQVVWADLIFGNSITGTNPNQDNPYTTGQVVIANVVATGIGRGGGINGTNTNDRYNATSWDTTSLDISAYFTFSMAPSSGATIRFDNFIYTGQTSVTGPTSFAFRSSIDGFLTNLGSPTASGTTINLSAAQFQNVSSAIEFRLYGWNASSGAGTFSVNDFSFNGTITAVPEPSSMALVGLMGGVATVWGWRKRRGEVKVT